MRDSLGSLDDYQDAAELCCKHAEEGVVFVLAVGKGNAPLQVWGNPLSPEHAEAFRNAVIVKTNTNRVTMGMEPI